ncbi:four helix bundle protein [Ekhidna sp.]|uniref:four helix bundle protein n=1 Tax=Ekhidna sp. TaxID=2608089 RepID=UPI003B5BAB41
MENDKRPNVLLDLSYDFALAIVNFSRHLQKEEKEFVLSKQVLRSGTAIGALSEEAQQAESKADFIHKLAIANKEAHETHYWLRLIKDSSISTEVDDLIEKSEGLKRLLVSIIKSSKMRAV